MRRGPLVRSPHNGKDKAKVKVIAPRVGGSSKIVKRVDLEYRYGPMSGSDLIAIVVIVVAVIGPLKDYKFAHLTTGKAKPRWSSSYLRSVGLQKQ